MNRKVILGMISLFFLTLSGSCLAMTFSQPIPIGHAGRYEYIGQSPEYKGGYFFEGTTYNNGNVLRKDGVFTEYGKGIAMWGSGKQSLYCKYAGRRQSKNEGLWFGGKNNYLVEDKFWRELFRIETDEGLVVYPLYFRYNLNYELDVLGCRKDGSWVKFIDIKSIVKQYFGQKNSNYVLIGTYGEKDSHLNPHITCVDSMIKVPYCVYALDPMRIVEKGEFRFKWDETAQWFGVEKVVY